MESPFLELKIVSANDLKKPGPFSSSLQPYVLAAISGTGAASPAHKTPIDSTGGRNPTWNHSLALPLPPISNNLSLRLQILSRRSLASDKLLGEVCVPLLELLNSPAAASATANSPASGKFVSYQIKKPSGRSKGVLTFSYNLAGKSSGVSASVSTPPPANFYPPSPLPSAPPAAVGGYKYDAYHPPPPAAPTTSYGYPVQGYPGQTGYGYGYPGQASYGYGYPGQAGSGYGYPGQAGHGYGYSGPVVQPNRKQSSGLGLGAGLLGGALAGLLVGDLVSDGGFF